MGDRFAESESIMMLEGRSGWEWGKIKVDFEDGV